MAGTPPLGYIWEVTRTYGERSTLLTTKPNPRIGTISSVAHSSKDILHLEANCDLHCDPRPIIRDVAFPVKNRCQATKHTGARMASAPHC